MMRFEPGQLQQYLLRLEKKQVNGVLNLTLDFTPIESNSDNAAGASARKNHVCRGKVYVAGGTCYLYCRKSRNNFFGASTEGCPTSD